MFGYIRPLRSELKVYEWEGFQGVYCGLCHTLGKRYGLPARFVLNYDLTFFASVLSAAEGELKIGKRRCAVHPLRKRCTACAAPSLDLAADVTVLLIWLKLDDAFRDGKGLKKAGAFLGRLAMRPFYRRAKRYRPSLAAKMEASIAALSAMEKDNTPSVDRTADAFAAILSDAAGEAELDEKNGRILRTMFYHIGRWIYIIDACDDYESDRVSHSYNPIACRYGLGDGTLPGNVKEEIKTTLTHSLAAAASAFELLNLGRWEGLEANILYQGLYAVTEAVLDGSWRQRSNTDERPL